MRAGLLTERYTYQPGTHRLGGIATPGWRGWKTANVLSDAVGNIVRMPRQGQSLDLDYAANNRLAQVAKAGRIVGSYLYDANGLRAQKTTGGHVRQFIYDDQARLLGDYTPGTQQKREYLLLEGNLVATLDTSAQNLSIHYVGTDFLGTPRRVVNPGGYPVWGWAYAGEAFGDASALGSYDLAMRFPGQCHDAESGLNYNVHRDYSPATGRYVESDPIRLRGGANTYAYVNNSPLYFVDSSGTQAYASPYRTRGASTIICDGNGEIIVFVLDNDPCTRDCTTAHEEVHRQDALKSNSAVCHDQQYGMQVDLGDQATNDKSETRAFRKELDCLRKKLAALKDCDKCRQSIEKEIKWVEGQVVNYGYRAEHPTNGW